MRYHNITKDDMLNGEGLRVVLWVAGCGHACPGCHNPVTWDANGGLPFDEAAEDELFAELSKDYVSGVTLSGGDPLFPGNRADIAALCARIRQRFPDKTIWLYTGYTWEEIQNLPLLKNVDVVVDGRFVQALADSQLHWRGSANQRVIDVQRTRASQEVVLL
ncbi:anaerobic ribonucleoside-triphosphate reductase activating protein [Agathobaculum sp. Marseille-P7918]|uniref:anaerobic ribonucleoside-triphosphate reductase activating protein n=1 Tax=Agathobaculum sp. Marseille-P7918 TaxID=2479843 RepID=UPI000F6351E7|nr:anaerobic ribonucleoside-triphosphate reductase activating protein [Agathobaculum sp. Marseille-P7918]